MKNRSMIRLGRITPEEVEEIKNWPAYGPGSGQMDYALRENGWIDEFRGRSDAFIYSAQSAGKLTGFSLLLKTRYDEAEFRVAVHPLLLGRGLGGKITTATLKKGFEELCLKRIVLIVRRNNFRAVRLYERLGFFKTGESVHTIQGRKIEFIDMEMSREQFRETRRR